MYSPDSGCVRPLRHLCAYATGIGLPLRVRIRFVIDRISKVRQSIRI